MTALTSARPALCILFTSALLSGCATVDLQSMGGTATTQAVEAEAEQNVVQRSVERLRAAFASRGLGEKSSRLKMQAAADVLLKGLSARTASTADDNNPYADKPVSVLIADMDMARGHIDQTTRAAEIYLALAKADLSLDDELESLQSALLVCEQAGRVFAEALPEDQEIELTQYKTSVDALRDVTDGFGDRVRIQRSDKLALNAASTTS